MSSQGIAAIKAGTPAVSGAYAGPPIFFTAYSRIHHAFATCLGVRYLLYPPLSRESTAPLFGCRLSRKLHTRALVGDRVCTQIPANRFPSAVAQIDELLEGGAGLGRAEEGCVESLNVASRHDGFVWGEGINPVTGQSLSIVFDSYTMRPAIVLTPVLPIVRQLIQRFGLLGGTEKMLPRYSAGSGDFYLLNTASHGSCIVIRSKSGTDTEAPSYTALYPSVAVAWAQSIKILKRWQWPTESQGHNSNGEVVFRLFPPGSSVSDATITYNPRTGRALWGGYAYASRQSDIAPSELEQDAQDYLQ